MTGTLVNAGAVIVASATGLTVHKHLSRKFTDPVFQTIGLATIAIGISMTLATENLLFVVASLVLGTVLGQWIGIDEGLRKFSCMLRNKRPGITADDGTRNEEDERTSRFAEGFLTATMLFCLGSMAILGAIEDGMGQTPVLLYTKSIMDAVSALILTASFGVGVMFSAIPILIYQGGLTLSAVFLTRHMSETMIADMTGVGGVMLIGLGISLLRIKEINVTNMLPALVVVLLVSYLFG